MGGFTAVTMIFFKPRKRSSKSDRSFKERIDRLDILGSVLLFGSAIMFFLSLNYADLGTRWDDPLIIGLLVGCGVSALAFAGWQLYRGDKKHTSLSSKTCALIYKNMVSIT